jgi:hypothetical protein
MGETAEQGEAAQQGETAKQGGWWKPIAFSIGAFLVLVIALLIFVYATSNDALPFNYPGFDTK